MNIKIGTNVIDTSGIAIIGEYTIDIGPFADDHFLVIILDIGKIISFPVATVLESLDDLGKSGFHVDFKLSNSTENKSRVVYPICLKERPVFNYKSTATGWRGIINKIKHFGVYEISLNLTVEINEYMRTRKPAGGKRGQV